MKITKKFKGVLGLALSAILTLGTVNVNAETANSKNPALPDPTRTGSITIHKYAMDSIPNPGTSAPGTELTEEEVKDYAGGDVTKLEGVTFEVEKVLVAEENQQGTFTYDNVKYIVDSSFTKQTKTTGAVNTDDHGVAKFTDLPQGIYLVTELDNSGVLEKGNPFLVSIPMAHPTNPNSWLYDVHVYPKNVVAGAPSIEKDVTQEGNKHDSANIGDTVTWIIKPSIPEDIADAKQYDIIDTLDSRLNYTGNLKVYYLEYIEGQEKPNEVKIPEEWYSAIQLFELNEKQTIDVSGPTIGQVLNISFNETGRKELAKLYKEKKITSIRISFTTVINTSADLGQAIPNNATLNYTNSFGTNTEYDVPEKDRPEVHTGGVLLEKVDASDNNVKLSGAKFKIYPTEKDAKAGTNAIMNPANKTEEWEVTTDEDGIAIFKGLSYGTTGNAVDQGLTTYWIVETVAPTYDVVVGKDENGENIIEKKQYNLLKAPLEVTVTATSHLESNKVVVENRKFTLPVTGGVGTVIFTLGGLAIMGAAAFLYMRTTRRA